MSPVFLRIELILSLLLLLLFAMGSELFALVFFSVSVVGASLVVVIGAGSAGLVSAYIAAAVKAKVTLIERDKMGGDCLNTGCVPSKALLHAANVAHQACHSEHLGVKTDNVQVDFKQVHLVVIMQFVLYYMYTYIYIHIFVLLSYLYIYIHMYCNNVTSSSRWCALQLNNVIGL